MQFFCPMKAKLVCINDDLKNHIMIFPIIDYKIPLSSKKSSIFENDDIHNKNLTIFVSLCLKITC